MAAIVKTNLGLNLLRDALSGAQNPLITYIALGSSSVAPTVNDVLLGNEVFRKAVTSYTIGASGEILISTYIAPGDTVGTDIEEVGVFGGSSATSAANTGVLIAHGLYAHNPKTNLESLQVTLDLTFT